MIPYISNQSNPGLRKVLSTFLLFTCLSLSLVNAQVQSELQSLYELAKSEGGPTTQLGTVLDSVGLNKSALSDSTAGPFTLLGPTNEAFASVPERYLEASWNDYLRALLQYHVVVGKFSATDLQITQNLTLPTVLPGKNVTVTKTDPLTFNDNAAELVAGNLEANNGVLHVISQVLFPPNSKQSLLDQLASRPNLSIFMGYVERLDLTSTLAENGPWTFLVPTNQAFQSIPSFILNRIDEGGLTQIILHHVLSRIAFAYPLGNENNAVAYTNMLGLPLELYREGVVGLAQFAAGPNQKDVMASNGVWHAIDTLIIPIVDPPPTPSPVAGPALPTILDVATSDGRLTKLVDAVLLLAGGDLDELLAGSGPFTLFAPNNQAFAGLPAKMLKPAWKFHLQDVLEYHVIPGDAIQTKDLLEGMALPTAQGANITVTKVNPNILLNANNAQVLDPDISASNGILHVINKILLPPFARTNITQVMTNNAKLTRLTELVEESDFLSTLQQAGPFTLLAPINAAFNKVPASSVLGTMSQKERQSILSYHVIPEIIPSSEFVDGATFKTLQGNLVVIMNVTTASSSGSGKSSKMTVNGAALTETDVLANNGILHFIDKLLIPIVEGGESVAPTMKPSLAPTKQQATTTSLRPTARPSPVPDVVPAAPVTKKPTMKPSPAPVVAPAAVTKMPTTKPSSDPVVVPAAPVTKMPTMKPSLAPNTPQPVAPSPLPTEPTTGGCNAVILAYAQVCCPVTNPAFQDFCDEIMRMNVTGTVSKPIVVKPTNQPTN